MVETKAIAANPKRRARLGGTLARVVWSPASRPFSQEAELVLILGYLQLFWKVFGIKKLKVHCQLIQSRLATC